MRANYYRSIATVALSLCTAVTAELVAMRLSFAGETYSVYAERDFPETVYWGDTHVHSNLSSDSYTFGNRVLSPDFAYRFARGETIHSSTGQQVRLSRPLDFLVVADHGEFLGLFPLLAAGDEQAQRTVIGKRWAKHFAEKVPVKAFMEVMQVKRAELDLQQDAAVLARAWQQVTAAADRFNDPGHFTALIGYEWTSMPTGNNLHRNVIFRDDASRANQLLPFTAMDSHDPEDLWRHLERYEKETGGRVLAIPHNGNGSNGAMFPATRPHGARAGEAVDPDYARARSRWEPVAEVTQIKGDGEAHPTLSPEDEFADFETWDDSNFGPAQPPKERWMLKHEYARGALKLGLELEDKLGANPYRFGMIGSSDAHTSLAAVEENSFFGKYPLDEPSPGRTQGQLESMLFTDYAASGFAAVWARENTREGIFDAFLRREVYATTGPRMTVRFFGGWDFAPQDHLTPDHAAIGYTRGVPMGALLPPADEPGNPSFLVSAARDPLGANLDRIQIVKGWLDDQGNSQEEIYDVALSDSREPALATARKMTLQSTVEPANATYTNTIGSAQLATVWQDPDFDPGHPAFYYLRVLEIPTPRWTTYDAVFYANPVPERVALEIQERAYTSPIWYQPPAQAGVSQPGKN